MTMNHKPIQRRLILLLDDELPETERGDVAQHLQTCLSCSAQLDALARVWRIEEPLRRLEPSPYLGMSLDARIQEYETHRHVFADSLSQIVQPGHPALALLTLVAAILLGVYLGDVPVSSNSQGADVPSAGQDRGRFFSSIYLDSFRDLPPQSLGGIYVTLATGKEGGAR